MLELVRSDHRPFDEWLKMEDVRQYLLSTTSGDIPIHFTEGPSGASVFHASILLPKSALRGNWVEELLEWNFNPSEGTWSYGYSFGARGLRLYQLYKPFDSERPPLVERAVPIVVRRSNICTKVPTPYFEANPQLTQVHDLHWLDDHSAYCTVDSQGDIREVIKVGIEPRREIVSIADDVLYKHLLLGKYVLVRFFDVDRWAGGMPPFPSESDHAARVMWRDQDIYARWTPVQAGSTPTRAFLRGFQVVRPPLDSATRRMLLEGSKAKEYCTFIAQDWKHDRIAEVTCDPKQLGNYFVESPHPFETTPAFFKREVLRKYQDDPDKYTVKERNITCRNSWSLRYDVNEAGQVHAYLIDLSHLPYAEQLYWKSHNEAPKGAISTRSYKTDFLGEWYSEPEPLRDLKRLLENFPNATTRGGPVAVWRAPEAPDADLTDRVHYLAGTSEKEWESAIVALDKLVVEGIHLKHLRQIADALKITHERLGSISLLAKILDAESIASDISGAVIEPLKELQTLRSLFAPHRKGTDAAKAAKQIRKKHRDLAAHFHYLVQKVFQSMTALADLVEHGYLNMPNVAEIDGASSTADKESE